MNEPSDLEQLRKQWGERWECWVVHRVYGGPVWCARRHDNHRKVINADTAEHLSEYLAEAEADHSEWPKAARALPWCGPGDPSR